MTSTAGASAEQVEAAAPGPRSAPEPESSPNSRPSRRGQIASYGSGRVCREADCSTQLSMYNDRTICANHGPSR